MRGSLDDARQDGVHSDVGGSELLGEALGQSDYAKFGGRVRRAKRVTETARRRGQVDDRAPAGGLEQRHGKVRAQELPGQADVDGAPPILRFDILDAAGRPRDPRIVDQRVKPAKGGFDVVEQARHVRFGRYVRLRDAAAGMGGAVVGEELVRDVADMDPRAARQRADPRSRARCPTRPP